jgi:hypothetical protein
LCVRWKVVTLTDERLALRHLHELHRRLRRGGGHHLRERGGRQHAHDSL